MEIVKLEEHLLNCYAARIPPLVLSLCLCASVANLI
jgi:hypothetical protein